MWSVGRARSRFCPFSTILKRRGAVEVAGITEWATKSEVRMESESKPEHSRKPYEPPQLTAISLRPEEAVLGHCKISGSGGPVSSSCANLNCMTLGS